MPTAAPLPPSLLQPLTPGKDAQRPFDVAVILPTTGRPSLLRAARSVFHQDLDGRIQLLIGVDTAEPGLEALLATLVAECPAKVSLFLFNPGYSTSRRHGGLFSNHYSGALRTILSFAANSRYLAYLDDDDWYAGHHLSSLLAAVAGKQWAFSLRWMVDQVTGWPLCPDEWDSLGPGKGINAERYGGFVSPSNLLLDREATLFYLPLWSLAAFDDGTGEDRLLFNELKNMTWASNNAHTCFYELRPDHQAHAHHAREFAQRGIRWHLERDQVPRIQALTAQAQAQLEGGAPAEAAASARQALTLHPYHQPTLSLLAQAEWQLGQQEAALTHLEQARAADDQTAEDGERLSAWLQALGRSAAASTARQRLERRFPPLTPAAP